MVLVLGIGVMTGMQMPGEASAVESYQVDVSDTLFGDSVLIDGFDIAGE